MASRGSERELAVTLVKEDFPFPSSGQASRKRMSVSWECHLLRIDLGLKVNKIVLNLCTDINSQSQDTILILGGISPFL